MRTPIVAAVAVRGCITPPLGRADTWAPIKQTEFSSASAKHVLKIEPHPRWPEKPGHYRAILYMSDGATRTEVWSRFRINNQDPVRVYASDRQMRVDRCRR
jgi:hypothetical protein